MSTAPRRRRRRRPAVPGQAKVVPLTPHARVSTRRSSEVSGDGAALNGGQARHEIRKAAIDYFGGRTKPFTQPELCELLGVTRFTLRRWRDCGLRCFTIGKILRYHVEDVYVFVLKHTA
ncbi:helix-turn-helix domain-containing protein [Planctomycetota bacterium]